MTGQSSSSSSQPRSRSRRSRDSIKPTKPLTDEEVQYLSLILEIIDQQNWEAFGYAIISKPRVFQSFARTIQESDELNGMTILHACVRFNPPPQIIKILLDLVPESPSRVDCLQRTPLHVAAGTRASVEVIELLASSHPAACTVQDEDGKTPLHLACDNACELFEGDHNATTSGGNNSQPPRYEVVRALLKANPNCAPMEDEDGMSALEHAIFSDAPIKVVKLLQYATKKQCEREQQRECLKRSRRVSQDSYEEGPQHQHQVCKAMDVEVPCVVQKEKQESRTSSSSPFIPATKGEFVSKNVLMSHAA